VALAYQVADPPVYVLGRKPGTNVFRPRTKEHPEDETFAGLLLLKLEGRVFFVNAEHIAQKIRTSIEEINTTIVALDLSGVPDLEYTALKMLIDAEKRQRDHGVRVWLIGMNPHVFEVVQRSHLGEVLRRDDMHFNLEIAVAKHLGTASHDRK
jgi:sulfate permease, SulP family